MKTMEAFFPPEDTILSLAPEDLAPLLLQYLILRKNDSCRLNRYNFGLETLRANISTDQRKRRRISERLIEAWMWLEREGLLAPIPDEKGEWRYVTERGLEVQTPQSFATFAKSNLMPQHSLHPIINQKVRATFIKGDYDTAIFQAFKEVEIAIRKAGNYPDKLLGVQLARTAFHPEQGQLTNKELPFAEREADSFLFVGALGRYKNPHSHRDVGISDPAETAEIISFASQLLKIIDARKKKLA